jgi:hypothetical protein
MRSNGIQPNKIAKAIPFDRIKLLYLLKRAGNFIGWGRTGTVRSQPTLL